MKNNILLIFYFLLCYHSLGSQVTIFTYGSSWKYKDIGSNEMTSWRDVGFNDTTWAMGNAQFGYGEADETTIVSYGPDANNKFITTYFRKVVNIPSVSAYSSYQFNVLRDDGIVVYVNGSEIYRSNMGSGTILYNTFAATNCSDDGQTVQSSTLTLAGSQFVDGDNTIAVEIHQTNLTSSDLTFDMQLRGLNGIAGDTIIHGPYIQSVNPTSAILRWRTNNTTDSKVMFGTDSSNLDLSLIDTTNTTEHTIQLTGLSPYTKYFYAVGSSAIVLQSGVANNFNTHPIDGQEGFYRFWVTGDCGNNSINQANNRNQYDAYVGNGITNGWLLLGDNAYNGGLDNEFTNNFFNIYQGSIMKHAPLWPCPGNHDYSNSGTIQDSHIMPYYDIFNVPIAGQSGGVSSGTEAYYSYNYGNIHFLALDSYGEESNMRLYDTTGAQAVWVKQDLDANTLPWVIAYWHHPPYTKGSHNSDTETELINMRQNFLKILERYQVDLVLCGHSHNYERSKLMKGHYGVESSFNDSTHNLSTSSALYNGSTNSCPYMKDIQHAGDNGTVYVVSGSAGKLGGTSSGYPHNAMYYSNATDGGSLVIEVNKNRLDAKWLCADGVIRDNFTIINNSNQVNNYNIDQGDTVNLTASWMGQYNWTHSGETLNEVEVFPSINTTYTVTDPYACIIDSFNVTVNNPTLTTNIIVPNICEGSSTNISIPYNAIGHYWAGNIFTAQISNEFGSFTTPTNIGMLASVNSDSISATIPGTLNYGTGYLLRVISSLPNVISSTTPVIIHPLPIALASNSGPYCDGTNVQFNSSGGSTYNWLGPSSFNSSLQDPSINSASAINSGAYTVTVTSNGCSSTNTTFVTINPNPSAPTITSNGPIIFCAGGSVNLNSSYPTDNIWSNSETTSSINVVNSGTYSVVYTDINGCTSSSSQVITVNSTPSTPIITPGSATTFCMGDSVILTSSYVVGNSWNTNETTQSITVISTGNYSVIFTDSNGCTSSATEIVTVNTNPITPVILPNGPTTFCNGGMVNLSSSYPANNVWSTSQTSQSINITSSGLYSVTHTDINGCTSSASQNVTVNANPSAPIITPSGPTTFCDGNSIILTSSYLFGNNWSISDTNQSINVNVSDIYEVVYSDLNGCTSTSFIEVTVNPLPIAIASNTGPYCQNDTIQLNASGGVLFDWIGPSSFTNGNQNPTIPSSLAANSGTYTVTVTDNNNCSTTTTTSLVVNSTLPANPFNMGPFCEGDTIYLDAVNGAVSYSWTGPALFTSLIQNPFIHSADPSMNGLYSVVTTFIGGCTTSGTTNVIVNPNPASPIITPGSVTTFCMGDSVILTSSYVVGNSWNTNETTPSITVASSGTYEVTETDVNGCNSFSSIVITVNPLPNVILNSFSEICINYPTFTLFGGSPTGGTYSGPGVSSDQLNPAIAGLGNHNITYFFTDTNGCSNTAISTITISPCLGLGESSNLFFLSAYPNPFTESITINFHLLSDQNISIDLLDIHGRLLAKLITKQAKLIGEHTIVINADQYSMRSGIYLIQLNNGISQEEIKINYTGK